MIKMGKFDIIFGFTWGYWFQYWRPIFTDTFKIIDIGFFPIMFAIYRHK